MNTQFGRTLRIVRDAFRAKLWPIPVAGVVIAVIAGVLMPRLDAVVDDSMPGWLASIAFLGDPEASRTMLAAVASSLISVTALTFSLTVVTLQLASSQYSPRLLRTFTQDVFMQGTLALFLTTFTFALTVLRSVRTSNDDGIGAFVPRISVTFSLLLTLTSMIVLVLFLAHLTSQIRVETMLNNVQKTACQTSAANLDLRSDEPKPMPGRPVQPARIFATFSGFLVSVDHQKLVNLADASDVIIGFDCEPGDFIVTGTPIASFWRPGGGRLTDTELTARLRETVCNAVTTGSERNAVQDIGFGLGQLTDVVNKALSPGVNDPTTAVHAIGHISILLIDLMQYELGPTPLVGEQDITRVIIARPTLNNYLELALAQPRIYGVSDPVVVKSLFQMLQDLAWNARPEQRPVIAAQLDRLHKSVATEPFDALERNRFAALYSEVTNALMRQAT
jgi:uncharacterized membrane protein